MTAPKNRILIHYHRPDADYDGIGMWCWSTRAPNPTLEMAPVDFDHFGAIFHLYLPDLRIHDSDITFGFALRFDKDWSLRDGPDHYWSADQGTELWIISEDKAIYRQKPETFPVLRAAWIDGADMLTLRLSHKTTTDSLRPHDATIRNRKTNKHIAVSAVEPVGCNPEDRSRLVRLRTTEPLDPMLEYEVSLAEYLPVCTTPRFVLLDPNVYSNAELGAVYTKEKTTFRVFAPTARRVTVVHYDAPYGAEGRAELELKRIDHGVWEGDLVGDHHGRAYMLRLSAPGLDGSREVVDPYARCTTGREGRGLVIDSRRLDPEGFRERPLPSNGKNATDAIIYEVSIRDLTIDPSSGVEEPLRGRYLGAAKMDTSLPGSLLPTGLDHIASLGVTHLQVLPVHDFDNDEEDRIEYNWGYMTSHFFGPDGWYATNLRNESRVREFKQFVDACHENGLRVVMDVVFNHTALNATFESIVPGYYHRLRDDGTFWNGSGTGNEFRSEAPMGRRFIKDCCRYFINEYRIDGYRFDLMALIDKQTLLEIRAEMAQTDPRLLMYGEPWAATGQDGAGLNPLVYKDKLRGSSIGAFNDHYRNALKGSSDGAEGGWLQTGQGREGVKHGLAGSIHDWAQEPSEVINYVDCHDNLTLYDKLKKSLPNAREEDIIRIQALAAGVLAVSQGIMFIHGGHEFARTKQGNHNSYDAPDEINRMDWTLLDRHRSLTEYVRAAIALRRRHRALRLHNRKEIDSRLTFRDDLAPSESVVVYTIFSEFLDETSPNEMLIIINAGWKEATAGLPDGEWMMEFAPFGLEDDVFPPMSDSYVIPAKSLAVFVR